MNISAARMLSLLVALLVGTGSGIAAAQDVPAAAIPELVRPATAKAAPAATDARAGKGVVRSRPIDLDVAALKRAAVRTGPDPAPSLSITFFDDAATAVAITRTERIGSNGTAYIGTVPGVPYIPSSPIGGDLPFDPSAGAAHYFGTGAYLQWMSRKMSRAKKNAMHRIRSTTRLDVGNSLL